MIRLYRSNVGWIADMSEASDSTEIKCLFGTCLLPTAFMSNAPSDLVVKAIRQLNPGETVAVSR